MSKRVILVLASDGSSSEDVWESLRQLEYEVHVLHDLVTCLEVLEQGRVDLALLDTCSGVREALEVLQALRSVRGNLPVVLMGEDCSSESMVAAYEGGASAFVSYPIRFEHVLEYIRRLLEGGR